MVQEPYHEAGLSLLLLYFYVQWVISPPCARPGHQGAKLAVLSRKDGRALYLPLRTAGSLVEPHLAAQAARHGMVRVRDLEPHAEGAARGSMTLSTMVTFAASGRWGLTSGRTSARIPGRTAPNHAAGATTSTRSGSICTSLRMVLSLTDSPGERKRSATTPSIGLRIVRRLSVSRAWRSCSSLRRASESASSLSLKGMAFCL